MVTADIKFNKSYKKLIVFHILFTMLLISIIFISRVYINDGLYPVLLNVFFTTLYIVNLNDVYRNYKFIIDNNYKIYTNASRNLVIVLIIMAVVLLLIIEIFSNYSIANAIFG